MVADRPDDRHALAFESSNRVVDAPRVDRFPFLAAKLGRANRFLARCAEDVPFSSVLDVFDFCPSARLPPWPAGPWSADLGRLIFGLLVLGSCISLFGKILYANG